MIKVGIIGTGNISQAHIESYLTLKDRCEIVAMCDIYPERAHEKIKRNGLNGVTVHSAHEELLARGDIELVSVSTPPQCHAEIAVNAMNAGVNVLVEKPMAASLAECDMLLETQKKTGKILSVMSQNRFFDNIQNVKEVLDADMVGRILHAQVDSFWWRGLSYYDLWWRGRWENEGGGCTLNHAVHHIDMMLWVMGRPESVTAVISNANHNNSEVEDISVAILGYPNGSLAQITSSVIHHGEEQQLIFQCENARVSTPWKVYANKSQPNGFPCGDTNVELENKLNEFVRERPSLKYTSFAGQIENVLTAIEKGGTPLVTGQDGRNAVELITAIYKAGTIGEKIFLPLQENDAFYTREGLLKRVPHFYEKNASLLHMEGETKY